MSNRALISIIKEFYETVVYALQYEWDDDHRSMSRSILELILELNNEADLFEECWNAVEDASGIQTLSDFVLSGSIIKSKQSLSKIACELKLQVLAQKDIQRLKVFDYDLLIPCIENEAFMGNVSACKLLAILNWTGIGVDKNPDLSVEIWKTLAMSGDETSMKALSFAYGILGDEKEKNKWKSVLELIVKAKEAFKPFIDPGKTDEDPSVKETASLIMCITGQRRGRDNGYLNRPLLYYALYSSDDLHAKLRRISSEQNYYLINEIENKYSGKKYGF